MWVLQSNSAIPIDFQADSSLSHSSAPGASGTSTEPSGGNSPLCWTVKERVLPMDGKLMDRECIDNPPFNGLQKNS